MEGLDTINSRFGKPHQFFWYSPCSRRDCEPKVKLARPNPESEALREGEPLVQQHLSIGNFNTRYFFNSKELDEEPTTPGRGSSRTHQFQNNNGCEQTGLYYYGARSRRDCEPKVKLARPSPAEMREYYNPKFSQWLSVDPLAYVDPHMTPYHFVNNNPIMLMDPTGMTAEPPESALDGTFEDGYVWKDEDGEWILDLENREWVSTSTHSDLEEVTYVDREAESQGGFVSGFVHGFGAGFGSTVDFFKSLGTKKGWQELGQGMENFARLGCQTCYDAETVLMRLQIEDQVGNYVKNIPNMTAYEVGYDLGYGTEKTAELLITRRVMPLPKSALGVKPSFGASRYTTIQGIRTYGKWGRFSLPRKTWINGASTIDKATYYNRNFIIPVGRVIGVGQLQHVQN